ncbi:MAG: zinc ribbon domain-containing protein [Candidatus Thorarchaeota archaeon]|nr:zinc ribbon domain-containing protein [Candidatus Thorarchaeota archaeon]
MSDQIACPECGNKMRKGSTFCINCGNKIPEDILPEQTLEEEQILGEEEDVLPAVEESGLDEVIHAEPAAEPILHESKTTEPSDMLSWDEGLPNTPEANKTLENEVEMPVDVSIKSEIETPSTADTSELSWEEGVAGIKEGMPFKEIEPPRVFAEAHDAKVTTDDALEHLFPEVKDDATRDAVAHLFPEGRGSTSASFIDVVVGKPERISIKSPLHELETPVCLSCGTIPTSDSFEYPEYVFDALGKARVENGERLLQENEHEAAIENFEMAKMLFEKSGNEKNLAEAIKRIDLGYDDMAKFHYDQAETHLKENEFEWAVVQFKKARELYMFTTDTKKRVKCAERARDTFIVWGKFLEDEGDRLAKAGETREALAKYQESAAKYREGQDTKKLRGLDRKIRKA